MAVNAHRDGQWFGQHPDEKGDRVFGLESAIRAASVKNSASCIANRRDGTSLTLQQARYA